MSDEKILSDAAASRGTSAEDHTRGDAATAALDAIAKLCGCPQWDYPGQVERDVGALAAERDALREIIAGRTTAPTAAENAAHDAAGGWWRYQTESDWGDATCQDVGLIREAWTITRWWPLDASGAPCAWPEVTP